MPRKREVGERAFPSPLIPKGPWPDYQTTNGFEHPPGHCDCEDRLEYLVLSRLPDFQILGVDIGQQTAACAVWRTVESRVVMDALAKGEFRVPSPKSPLCTVTMPDGRESSFMRLGSEVLTGGRKNQANWARFDRYAILSTALDVTTHRRLLLYQMDSLEKMAREFHARSWTCSGPEDKARLKATQLYGQSLHRNCDRAKIAFSLGEQRTSEALMLRTLVRWRRLVRDDRWTDEGSQNLWRRFTTALRYPSLVTPDKISCRARCVRKELDALAKKLVRMPKLRREFADEWKEAWIREDKKLTEWLEHLREWIVPKLVRPSTISADCTAKKISWNRLAAVLGLGRLYDSFSRRANPMTATEPAAQWLLPGWNDVFKAYERLNTQLIQQLATQIMSTALGLDDKGIPKYPACHAIAVGSREREEKRSGAAGEGTGWLEKRNAERLRLLLRDECRRHGILFTAISPESMLNESSIFGSASKESPTSFLGVAAKHCRPGDSRLDVASSVAISAFLDPNQRNGARAKGRIALSALRQLKKQEPGSQAPSREDQERNAASYEPRYTPDGHSIAHLRKEAKRLKKQEGIKLKEAYDLIAKDLGFNRWRALVCNCNKRRDEFFAAMYHPAKRTEEEPEYRAYLNTCNSDDTAGAYRLYVLAKWKASLDDKKKKGSDRWDVKQEDPKEADDE